MATLAISATQMASHANTLVASTVDTVTFTARRVEKVEVTSLDGASAIYFTVDGSVPTVGGAATWVVPATIAAREVATPATTPTGGATVVKVISAGTPIYSVSGV